MKKRYSFVLVITIVMFCLLLTGGTYAWLSFTATVGNNKYIGNTTCFLVDYNYNNDDNTTNISGTLMQTSVPRNGLSGKVTMALNSTCNVSANGTIYLKVNSATNSTLYSKVGAHCERKNTLETLPFYTTSSTCTSAGGTWVTANTKSALKYAVYNSSGTMLSSGHIISASDIAIYTGFSLSTTAQSYYVYVWLDGELATNSYANLPFSGYIHLGATQVE